MPKKSAKGGGTIRKKTVTRNGAEYTYWEARYTVGRDPGTGKQVQRSIYCQSQKEARQRLTQVTGEIDAGIYKTPSKMTIGEWLDTWADTYLGGVKPFTVASYKGHIENHLKPALGAVRLEALDAPTIQHFYNGLTAEREDGKPGLNAKTVKNVHGVLHRALQKAVAIGYIKFNPAASAAITLPRIVKKELAPLDEVQSKAFLQAIQGHPLEVLFTFTLFTGLREGEALGLGWDSVDFDRGCIRVYRQLQKEKKPNAQFYFAPLKNGKERTISPAPWVMKLLKAHRAKQSEQRLLAGPLWENSGLVFTNELGHHLQAEHVRRKFKAVAASIGRPDARFHDLRHSYAVAAIRSGDDIKTVQSNLGHATATFTLDVYGHCTDQMKQASAARMETYITDILGQKKSG